MEFAHGYDQAVAKTRMLSRVVTVCVESDDPLVTGSLRGQVLMNVSLPLVQHKSTRAWERAAILLSSKGASATGICRVTTTSMPHELRVLARATKMTTIPVITAAKTITQAIPNESRDQDQNLTPLRLLLSSGKERAERRQARQARRVHEDNKHMKTTNARRR